MSCNQTLSGLAQDCATSMGGISEVYIASRDDVTAVTVTENKVTAITMASTAKFKKYYFRPQTGSMTSNLQVNAQNGTNYWQTDLVLQFARMETTKRIEISALAVNDMVAIVKDANGVYWYLGHDNPITATAGTGQTGTARDDGNYYQITLQDTSNQPPYEVEVGEEGVVLDTIVG